MSLLPVTPLTVHFRGQKKGHRRDFPDNNTKKKKKQKKDRQTIKNNDRIPEKINTLPAEIASLPPFTV